MLVIFFAFVFVPLGLLMPHPKWSLISTLVALTTATFLGIDSAYDANFLTFVNANLAGLAGVIFASVLTGVLRPFGSEAAADRLARSSWRDVVLSVSALPLDQQRDLSARMLDRLVQLIPRHASSEHDRHPATQSLRDMRIALNSLDLCRLSGKFAREVATALGHVLEGIKSHYEQRLAFGEPQNAPFRLEADIDAVMRRIMAEFALGSDVPDSKRRKEALHALVGLRLSLFPEAKLDDAP